MDTTFQQTAFLTYTARTTKSSLFSRFFAWCNSQEDYRFGWLGGIIIVHGCVLTPLTLIAIILSGSYLTLFIAAIVAMGISLVTNLAAMPTKVTIPVFFLSILIDMGIVISCIFLGFKLAAAGF